MRWFRWRGAVLVFIGASFWPLHILTVNLFGIVRPERVALLIALIWVVGTALIWLLHTLGIEAEVAENSSFAALVFAMNGGLILREFGSLGYVILIGCPILAGWIFQRLRGHLIITALVWGTAVALAVGPVATLFESWSSQGGPSVVAESPSISVELSQKPNIFLVVFDGYPGAIAAELDALEAGSIDIAVELQKRGFEVPASSWSSYWSTTLSIPSLMEMNYPVVESSWQSGETKRDLQQIIAGDSTVVDVLSDHGYDTHMVEAGWSTGSCGSAFDNCVPSPLLDEAIYLILEHTLAWSLIDDSPGPYVLGTLAGFDWLLEHGPDLSRSSSPDFVFMHVVSPHPPFLLDADCSVEMSYERTGGGFNISGVTTDQRAEYLVDQMDCADKLMLEVADSVSSDDIVVFVSDHGTDRRYQADPDNVDWDRETTVERLNNFLAIRLPDGCSVGEEVIVPNVFRLVLGCLSPDTVQTLPERMWINPMVELDSDRVEELLSMRAESGSDTEEARFSP